MDLLYNLSRHSRSRQWSLRQVLDGIRQRRRHRPLPTRRSELVQLLSVYYDGNHNVLALVARPQEVHALPLVVVHSPHQYFSGSCRCLLPLFAQPSGSHDFHCLDGSSRKRSHFILRRSNGFPRKEPSRQGFRPVPDSSQHDLPLARQPLSIKQKPSEKE